MSPTLPGTGLILERDDLDLLGHGEHNVEVGHIEQFRLPVLELYSTEQTGRPSRCKAAAENARKRHGKTLQSGTQSRSKPAPHHGVIRHPSRGLGLCCPNNNGEYCPRPFISGVGDAQDEDADATYTGSATVEV